MINDPIWNSIEAELERHVTAAWEVSQWMADHPELPGQERQACQRHSDFLRQRGFEVTSPAWTLETAYDAVAQGLPGPSVALMAEYDALPGVGHACGHNLHGAMCLLAAAALKPAMAQLKGTLRVVGCPAEEGFGGKAIEAREGAFDGLGLAIMIHCTAGASYVPNRALALEGFDFLFQGKTAHASGSPWEGLNALNGVQLLFHSLDMLRQHVKPSHRIHGVILEGGLAPNVVPERALARIEFRAPTSAEVEALREKIFNCARGAALATGTQVSWTPFEEHFDDMHPSLEGERLMAQVFQEMGVELSEGPTEARGSTDVGNVSYRCPAVHGQLDVAFGQTYAAHTREFAQACVGPQVKEPLALGAKILARTLYRYLTEPETQAAIGQEFQQFRR